MLALVPRVEITAIIVLPAMGAVVIATLNEVAVFAPVLPFDFCTRLGGIMVLIVCAPISLAVRLALPVRVKLLPSRLFEIDRIPAVAIAVPSYIRVPDNWRLLGVIEALATVG